MLPNERSVHTGGRSDRAAVRFSGYLREGYHPMLVRTLRGLQQVSQHHRTAAQRCLAAVTVALSATLVAPAGLLPNTALASSSRTLEATYTGNLTNGWQRVERWLDNSSGFVQESYPADGRGNQTGDALTYFGGVAQPFSGRFLMYYGPHWQTNTKATPVLLIDGANDMPDHLWADPAQGGTGACGQGTGCPTTGFMQYLDGSNYRVFAIGFAHKNGDNFFQSEEIYDAIQIIKSATGASKVDIVGVSKGAFAPRFYVSSLKKSWGTSYAGDVRKMILIGGPNKGFDWGYRHGWNNDILIWPECGGALNAPAPHTDLVCYGISYHHPELSYDSANFPGAGQMLYRWDGVYALPLGESDDYTTYYGGQGVYSKGNGIQEVVTNQSQVQAMINAGVPSSVAVYQLCGSANTIFGVHNEHTGPSDGALFISSCSATDGIGNLAAESTVGYNHLQLAWEPSDESQMVSWLG